MDKIRIPKRAQRRAWYERLQIKALIKAKQRFEELSKNDAHYHHALYHKMTKEEFLEKEELVVQSYYANYMHGDGHWIDGGCSKARCCMCGNEFKPPRARDLRRAEQAKYEVESFEPGDYKAC